MANYTLERDGREMMSARMEVPNMLQSGEKREVEEKTKREHGYINSPDLLVREHESVGEMDQFMGKMWEEKEIKMSEGQ